MEFGWTFLIGTDVFVLLVHFFWRLRPLAAITMKRFDGKSTSWLWETSAFNCCLCMLSQVATPCRIRLERARCLHWKWLWIPITLKLNYSASRMQLYRMSCARDVGLSVVSTGQRDTTMNALRYKIHVCSTRLNVRRLKSLPQTDDSLALHLKRDHIQAMLWKAPDRNQPPNVCLGDYGWDISAGTPSPVRASKHVEPPGIMKVIACSCRSDTPCRRKNSSC